MEKQRPWVSVIVPIYNAEQTLKKCIFSVLRQSFQDFELLLIDDGSTDGSEAICRKYAEADSRVRYFHKENRGCFQSRICGMELARGTYILNCDADDYYLTRDAFQRLYDVAEQQNCQVVQFSCMKVFRHLKRPRSTLVKSPVMSGGREFAERDYPLLLCTNWSNSRLFLSVWSKLYHRSLLTKLPSAQTAERVFHGEDIILNLYLLENLDSIYYIPDVLYGYRQFGETKRFCSDELLFHSIYRSYQLYFLERWSRSFNATPVLEQIYFGTAQKLFSFTLTGERTINTSELEAILSSAFLIPFYQQAQAYYLEHDQNKCRTIQLLRSSDPKVYIAAARAENHSHRIEKWFHRLLYKIYASI